MKIIKQFQTEDGKVFESQSLARTHEVEVETLAQLRALLKTSIDSSLCRQGNIDNVLKNILMEPVLLIDILQSYRKKLPKVLSKQKAA
jgi:hypothetical protein